MAKNKHLTDLERLEIEHALKQGTSLKKIAAKIGKHHSTVAREIRARSVVSDKGRIWADHQPLRVAPLVREAATLHGQTRLPQALRDLPPVQLGVP